MKTYVIFFSAFLFGGLAMAADEAPPREPISADRPGIANSSEVVEKGASQIELGVERDHFSVSGVDERDDTVPTLIRYGLAPKLELRLETNLWSRSSVHSSEDHARLSGLAPLSLGFKYQFQQAVDATHRPSLGIIAEVSPPSGTGDFRSHHTTGFATFAADVALNEHWSLNPNVGLSSDRDDEDRQFTSGTAALTLTWLPTPLWQPFIDAGIQSPEKKSGGTSVTIDTGVAWIVRNDTQLDVAFGWGAAGDTSPNFFWTAGVSQRF